jgi:hypothetical protein
MSLFGQSTENCFLDDFEPKTAVLPHAVTEEKPLEPASVIITINDDTPVKISKYVFGNAIAAWAGAHDNPIFVEGVKILSPTLIRFPGGSWSNGYFWNKKMPTDVPDFIYDGTTYDSNSRTAQQIEFAGHSGQEGWVTTTDQYYALRRKTNVSQGLITINYGYARYGTSRDPVAQAAHLAADWVRYDKGATKFWEIGNENGGPWEYGWMIDTALNRDGQPQIITGALYGRHFKVFADSMKSAARRIGAVIYIGGQVVIDGPSSWNFVDKTWNDGFFKEAGDSADFYVIHNYFSTSNNVKDILNYAVTEPKRDMDFLTRDILDKKAYPKPVSLTEYNIGSGSLQRAVSYVNGMQAVVLICEMIKNNFGLGARWLLLTGEGGMFYGGSDEKYQFHPRPDFYYLHFLQKFYGDHAISAHSSNADILCYASEFSSGETGVIIVNTGTSLKTVSLDIKTIEEGRNYYIYSFTGGKDNGDYSQNVYINGYGPSKNHWGPFDELSDIPAKSYPTGNEIKFASPARSVQMIMIEGMNDDETNSGMTRSYNLYQNYPNPFNTETTVKYDIPETSLISIKIFNVSGEEIKTLVNEVKQKGTYSVKFDAGSLPSGIYMVKLHGKNSSISKKLTFLR